MGRSRIAGVVLTFAAAIAWLVAAANAELPPLSEFDQHTHLQYASNLNSGRSNFGIWLSEAVVPIGRPPAFRPDDPSNLFETYDLVLTTSPIPVWVLACTCTGILGLGVVLVVLPSVRRDSVVVGS